MLPFKSVNNYVVAIRHLTKHCEYGHHLGEALSDHLVSGLAFESIQCKLLTRESSLLCEHGG